MDWPQKAMDMEIAPDRVSKRPDDTIRHGQNFFSNHGDLLEEILKQLDAKSVGKVACVSRQWCEAAHNEQLWETICTRHWPSTHFSKERLKAVVGGLGGFRRFYVNCLHPLLISRTTSNSNSCLAKHLYVWNAEEINLSLSLFSIHCYQRQFHASPN
eukprot:Gb_29906 [translate_table: standard]